MDMRIVHEIKFFFSGWNFGVLFLLLFMLAFVFSFNFNVPVGEPEEIQGIVEKVGLTHSSTNSASYASVRVNLASGKEVDITLPRNVMVKSGDAIIVHKQGLLLKGAFYKYGSLPDTQ
ncbi:hypothetical protein [Microbulbifer discodermiae]|uniref:hypothetical protein n=1 Tax=Microbulbifer sp. 2201CG32-9 TaxID=3232309 RepID=UPI00345B6E6C